MRGGGKGERVKKGLKRVSFWWMIIIMMQLRIVLVGRARPDDAKVTLWRNGAFVNILGDFWQNLGIGIPMHWTKKNELSGAWHD